MPRAPSGIPVRRELPFEGFAELIERPLAGSDPRSLERIRRLFLSDAESRTSRPFSYLMKRLTGKEMDEVSAREHWRNALAHKTKMEVKLGRVVAVQAAAVDYFTAEETPNPTAFGGRSFRELDPVRNARAREDWTDRLYGQSTYLERLREEILRARRYSHALSAILLNVDDFHSINERLSAGAGDEVLSLIVNIIRRTVRTVDIVARLSSDRFIVILPNTNAREAGELAARIERTIERRCRRLPRFDGGRVGVTLSVGQCDPDEGAAGLVRRLEHDLGQERGAKGRANGPRGTAQSLKMRRG